MFPEGLKHILYSKTYGSEEKVSIMKSTSQHLTDDVGDHEKSDKPGSSNASDASD